jgi:hypothetical protein
LHKLVLQVTPLQREPLLLLLQQSDRFLQVSQTTPLETVATVQPQMVELQTLQPVQAFKSLPIECQQLMSREQLTVSSQ